ncbi:ABC transporter [Serratia sp. S1B]|nr:ABC transporter [Serratia sp. S1B]
MWAVEIKGIHKSYLFGQSKFEALRNINLNISSQCFTVLSGQSGSGKTTLLNVIGCLDRPDQGKLVIAGQDMSQLNDDQRSAFRAHHLGFIFQSFNLIPVLSVWENVEIPLILQGVTVAQRGATIKNMLEMVGLADKARWLPGQLSGGQRQRVAIARALINRPSLVLADEPTANLDSKTGNSILQLLRRLQQEQAVTVVFSSHDPQVIAQADTRYQVHDGSVHCIAV